MLRLDRWSEHNMQKGKPLKLPILESQLTQILLQPQLSVIQVQDQGRCGTYLVSILVPNYPTITQRRHPPVIKRNGRSPMKIADFTMKKPPFITNKFPRISSLFFQSILHLEGSSRCYGGTNHPRNDAAGEVVDSHIPMKVAIWVYRPLTQMISRDTTIHQPGFLSNPGSQRNTGPSPHPLCWLICSSVRFPVVSYRGTPGIIHL